MKKITSGKGKSFKITCKILDDGNKLQEINFDDGSQIKYITFTKNGKTKINGEEFEMPEGTIIETKSVNGRVFSQLIQTPDMPRKVINKPEYLDRAEQALTEFNQTQSLPAEMPEPEYILNLLGKPNSAIPLLNLSKGSYSNKSRTPIQDINYLEKSIQEGKLPKNTIITGVKDDGGKILTIPGNNCKYEVCGSEMRVIDNSGETKMIARYESGRESQGLWVALYDNGKPINGSHYASWNLEKPLSTVNYTYDNNTVITEITDTYGNKKTMKQTLPEDFYLDIDKGFKFVSSDKSHLGLIFENQIPFVKPD